MFAKKVFRVTEPQFRGSAMFVGIPVVRKGDNSKLSRVRMFTKSGSAMAGKDFNPVSRGDFTFCGLTFFKAEKHYGMVLVCCSLTSH